MVKNSPAIWETWVGNIPWRRAWQPTPVFLSGKSPGQRSPGGLQSVGSHRVGHDWSNSALFQLFTAAAAATAKSLQSCPTLCNPMDCSLPGFSVHGILQARILESVAMHFSRESSWPRDWTCFSCVFCIASGFFTTEPQGKFIINKFYPSLTSLLKLLYWPWEIWITSCKIYYLSKPAKHVNSFQYC